MDLFEAVPEDETAFLDEPDPDDAPKSRGRGRTKRDPTQPRTLENWFKQPHSIAGHCENPQCVDPRPPSDGGRNIVAPVPFPTDDEPTRTVTICHYCFIAGYPETLDG